MESESAMIWLMLASQSGSLVSVLSGLWCKCHPLGGGREEPAATRASADRQGGALGPGQIVLSPQLCRADLTSGQHGEIWKYRCGMVSSGTSDVESCAAILSLHKLSLVFNT